MRQSWFGRRKLWMAALALAICGCPGTRQAPPEPQDAPAALPLRLIVVDDPELGKAVQQQWQARAEGELEVRDLTSDEICDSRRKRFIPAD